MAPLEYMMAIFMAARLLLAPSASSSQLEIVTLITFGLIACVPGADLSLAQNAPR